MHTLKFSHRNNRQAFSLIEAAIVLGIIGLVIGGIYTAVASVKSASRVSNLIADLAAIRYKAGRLFPISQYPATGFTDMTAVAFNAGVFPASYKLLGNGTAASPDGVQMSVQLSCNTGVCPALTTLIRLDTAGSTPPSTLTAQNCREFLIRIGANQTGSNLMRAYVNKAGGINSITLVAPYSPTQVVCTAADAYIDLRYMP